MLFISRASTRNGADALSRSPRSLPPPVGVAEGEVQVATVTSQGLAPEDDKITTRQESAVSEAGPSNATATEGSGSAAPTHGWEVIILKSDSAAGGPTSDKCTPGRDIVAGETAGTDPSALGTTALAAFRVNYPSDGAHGGRDDNPHT